MLRKHCLVNVFAAHLVFRVTTFANYSSYVKAPWAGYKQSGFDRGLRPSRIDEYLETKQVFINLNE